ncbi:Transcriptional regulator, TetR family [Corynebacterium caspium DSM 44850]|nr:Transcriptional regulator, TetR family [Corynebacterium caspium DSM 44850]
MRADARRRRAVIIRTACELFTSRELGTVTMEEIARKSGVGIATLYRNFPDREAVIHGCSELLLEDYISLTKRATRTLKDIATATAENKIDNAEIWKQWRQIVFELVEMGIGALVPVLAPPSIEQLPPDLQGLRQYASNTSKTWLDQAKDLGLLHRDIDVHTFTMGLITVSRPPVSAVEQMAPNLRNDLIDLYLQGLRCGIPDQT